MPMLYEAPKPHECRGPWLNHEVGSIWRCECGQHWRQRGTWWERIGPRKARRILRQHGQEVPE